MRLPSLFLLAVTLLPGNASEGTKASDAGRESEFCWSELLWTSDSSTASTPLNKTQQQILLPYLARQTTPHAIIESEKASGDWFGQRRELANHGVNFSVTYTSDTAGNPVGGYRPGGCTYADVFSYLQMIPCVL
ncbi:MAG: hypothetical protein FJ390_03540 [Verrucomicrobia bacterium]|nr:hypothetical protein [Verrucomicrobiota bacterium]